MSKDESRKFYSYSVGVIVLSIVIYYVIQGLYQANIIKQTTANVFSLLIYLQPFVMALFISGIKGDTLEFLRMKRRFSISVKMLFIAFCMGVLAFVGGFMVVQKYTAVTMSDFISGLVGTAQNGWYTLLVGAIFVEAGFRGFLQNLFERHYSVLGSSMMTGITYAMWLTILTFISENPSLNCLLFVALQYILFSVFLGHVTRMCRRNLYPAIVFHLVWNLVAATMNFQTRIEFLAYSDLMLAIFCVLATVMYQLKRKNAKRKSVVKQG